MISDRWAVIGAGPVGACAARALAEALDARDLPGEVLLIDANDPPSRQFDGLAAAGPWAAGQLVRHFFAPGTRDHARAVHTHAALRALAEAGALTLHRRPWLVCAGASTSPLDAAAREVLAQAQASGGFEDCRLLRNDAIPEVAGLRRDQVGLALYDSEAFAVDPVQFVAELARYACAHPRIRPQFNTVAERLDGNRLVLRQGALLHEARVTGLVLAMGLHRRLLAEHLPQHDTVYLHVFDHRVRTHIPTVDHLVAGHTTIARYASFGPAREALRALLTPDERRFDINALFTDVPGLRRLLDTHFDRLETSRTHTAEARTALHATAGRLLDPRLFPGADQGPAETVAHIAAYPRLRHTDSADLRVLPAGVPVVNVQPARGIGLNQCAALGVEAARMLLAG